MTKKLLLFFIALIIYTPSIAQEPQLDNTFGATGPGYSEFNPDLNLELLAPNTLNSAAATSDGKTVVTGFANVGLRSHFVVAKVTETGYDTTFGTSGITVPVYQATNWSARGGGKDIVLQTDGKIVAVGWQTFNNSSYPNNGTFMLITRLNANGSLDTSFNGSGIQTIEINGNDFANTVAIQTDGKIIVGGYTQNGSVTEAIIARLNTDGSLDTSFDIDGIKSIATGNNYDQINDIAIQTDGKIIACGRNAATGSGSVLDFMTIRLNSNGSFDTSFNSTGVVLTSFSTSFELATCLYIQADNKILVGGYASTTVSGSTSNNYAILRYNTDGTLDTTFSGDGKYVNGFATQSDILNSISITGSRIYLGGYSYVNSSNRNDFFIVAITSSGTLDSTYNSGAGYYLYNTGYDDNGIVLVKHPSFTYLFGNSNNNFSYFKIGTINSNLFQNKLKVDFTAGDLEKNNGNLYYSGYNRIPYQPNSFTFYSARSSISKSNNDGVLNTAFGTNGFSGFDYPAFFSKISVNNDGKLYTIGAHSLYRYLDSGNLDLSFGQNGIINVTAPYNPNNNTIYCDELLVQNDNKILLISDLYMNGNRNINLLRYTDEGILDNSFDFDGQVFTTAGVGESIPLCGFIQPDQKILIGGQTITSYSPLQTGIMLVRYNNDGSLDNTFGNNGIQLTPIGDYSYINSIKVLNNGKILASGGSKTTFENFTLIKYNSDGTLDTSFGTNGIVTTSIGNSNSKSTDFIVLNDNKIIVVGESSDTNGGSYLTLAKYTPLGSLDTTFANNGIFQDYPDGISDYYGMKIDLENNNKITVLASNFNGLNTNTTLVRYILDINLGEIDFSETNNQSYIYPNPINEETNLVYTLNKETLITVELFDLQGKLVKTFFNNEIKSVGKHDEKLILPNYLQAGNYILKISSPKGSNSIKLIKK